MSWQVPWKSCCVVIFLPRANALLPLWSVHGAKELLYAVKVVLASSTLCDEVL